MADPHSDQRLAAILAADVAGYSKLMEADERATVATLDAYRAVFQERAVRRHATAAMDRPPPQTDGLDAPTRFGR